MNNPLISFIIPHYNDCAVVIPSLYAQTYKNFEIILVHDGPTEGTQDAQIINGYMYDPRLKLHEIPGPNGDWGHEARAYGLEHIDHASELIVFGGSDNYYVPTFLEEMVKPFQNEKVQATICNCIHNIRHYEFIMECKIQYSLIDCGNFMTRTKNAQEVGWKKRDYNADWWYINEIQQKYCKGPESVKKINKILFVHN